MFLYFKILAPFASSGSDLRNRLQIYVDSDPKLLMVYSKDFQIFLKFNIKGRKSNKAVLKVHKNENFFGSDFEFCTISLLLMLKY